MWSTLLMGPGDDTGFITSPTPTTLSIHSQPMTGDALEHALDRPGVDVGMLGIEFATKRRNRVNGRTAESSDGKTIEFRVDQSFGNCPQYITPRRWWTAVMSIDDENDEQSHRQRSVESQKSDSLSKNQIKQIQSSDTLFVATGYRGEGEDPRWGNDSSHRGGLPGWIKVRDSHTILLPDYAGNDHYNTLGNIEMDSRMGLTIPIFSTGGMIQLTGTAKVHYDEQHAKLLTKDAGAKRAIEFTIRQVNELPPASLPIRWASYDTKRSKRTLQVAHKIKESDDVTSFHLHPVLGDDPELWSYEPGQHLPITLLPSTDQQVISRTYSLSSGPDWGEYRISVKREPFGQASRYLHDHVQVGDKIQVSQPAGDFILDQDNNNRTLVLISGGVGVTPMLSMLHAFVSDPWRRRKAVWVHGARDGKHHPFRGEVQDLKLLAGDSLLTHVVYSQPKDDDGSCYDTIGHIDANLLQTLVPDLMNADFYMCGSSALMADIQDGLEQLGVDPNRIQYEQF
jgi:ferredoxin-NADP reductase